MQHSSTEGHLEYTKPGLVMEETSTRTLPVSDENPEVFSLQFQAPDAGTPAALALQGLLCLIIFVVKLLKINILINIFS
jgi:hypothetical protein